MNKFWDNVLKFPRFLVSVILGLILTIISPFFVLFKKPSTSFFSSYHLPFYWVF